MPIVNEAAEPAADLSNWRTEPFNRWAFHNVRSIVPVAEIESAPDNALPLVEYPVTLDAFAIRLPDGSRLDLQGFLRATATDGLVILRNSRLVFET
jgi:hypothetical protein